MVAAVCSECQSHPEHPEVSLSEKLRFWEFVFKLFYLTVAFLLWITKCPLCMQMDSQLAHAEELALLCLQLWFTYASAGAVSLSLHQCVHCHPEVQQLHAWVHPT